MIHCIGDSHVNLFSGADTMLPQYPHVIGDKLFGYRSYRLEARAAYNLANDIVSMDLFVEIISMYVKHGDAILLSYGEIDCRKHLPKYLDIEHCIDEYMKAVDQIIQWHKSLILLGPHLTLKNSSTKGYGTYTARMFMTERFNVLLEKECVKRGIAFVTIYRDLLDENELPDLSYFADYTERDIHLSKKALPLITKKIEALQCGMFTPIQ
jgi:hypothetical protein